MEDSAPGTLSWSLVSYPSSSASCIPTPQADEYVCVKGGTGGVVLSVGPDKRVQLEKRGPEEGSGRVIDIPLGRIMPRLRPEDATVATAVVVCSETQEFRDLARSQLKSTDRVLELGCSVGKCTKIIAKHSHSVYAVDCSKPAVEEARENYGDALGPMVEFAVMDVFKETKRLQELSQECDAVMVDINGCRREEDLIAVMRFLLKSRPAPRLVTVKNRELWKSLSKMISSPETSELFKHQYLSSVAPGWWADEWLESLIMDQAEKDRPSRLRRPHRYPARFNQDGNYICRFYNYDPDGCKKGDRCPYDHRHCHTCGNEGHISRACTLSTG